MSNLNLFLSPRFREPGEAELCCANPKPLSPRLRSNGWFVRFVAAAALGAFVVTGAVAGPVCKPKLLVRSAKLSEMLPPTLERKWTATVTVDASSCASTAGYFELGLLREKENSLDLEFREQFIWSTPSALIGVDFAADEAVGTYWIDSIQECPCAGR